MTNDERRTTLVRLLHALGYATNSITFEKSTALAPDDVQIGMTYARVVGPENCPDWRTSPITSYSNTWQGNFKCADVANRGLMVADPRDLEKGNGLSGGPDTTRATSVIQEYRAGKDFGKSAGSSGGNSSGESSSAVAAGVTGSSEGQ
jgi:type IV pilus biogenesis protein CpaD/CtpE